MDANNSPTKVDMPITDEDLVRLKEWTKEGRPILMGNLVYAVVIGTIARLLAAEELIESAGDLKRSEAAQEWLKTKGNCLCGIPVIVDPSLKPGQWRIKKNPNPERRYISEEDI